MPAKKKPTTKKTALKKELALDEVNSVKAKKTVHKSLPQRLALPVLIFGILFLILAAANKYLIVAWVDRQPVTKLSLYSELDKRYGKDVRDELVVEKLITSEAKNRNISVSEDEVNAEIKKLEDQNGGADKFNEALAAQAITRPDLERLIRVQLLRQKMFGQSVNITDEDVQKYIDDNKDQIAEVTDQIRTAVKEQLKQQKIAAGFNEWLTEAMKSSRVIRY